jgi:hypothetical protein
MRKEYGMTTEKIFKGGKATKKNKSSKKMMGLLN